MARNPLIELQLADGAQNPLIQDTIQMSVNGTQVTPTVTQTNRDGLNTTTIAYLPSTPLAYGSTNTVTCTYSDTATPADQFTKTWSFSVYTGDPIFADNFDASVQAPVLPPFVADAFEGTNCLRMARIGSGRPMLIGHWRLQIRPVCRMTRSA